MLKLKKEKLIVQVVVGYMYKVMKNGIEINLYRNEFTQIRHGNYKDFLDLIGLEISAIVVGNFYKPDQISWNTNIEDHDVDFIRLVKAGNSLKQFYLNCINEYGEFQDLDLPNRVFEDLTLFELLLRIHRNNRMQRVEKNTLESIINEIQDLFNLTDEETKILHEGRKFLNAVKRPNKLKTTWQEGIDNLDAAMRVLELHRITI